MTTTKSVITSSIPTDVTTVYTNSSAGGAVLKSLNMNGIADASVFQETTEAGEWSYFGSPDHQFSTIFGSTGNGFGVPYPIQLSDDRVLLLSLPHFMHYGHNADFMGGEQLHAQICEYQTNKYVAGPIVNVQMPTTEFNSSSYSLYSYSTSKTAANRGSPLFKAIALSPTVVVCAYRINNSFRIFRLTISGNTVNTTGIVSLDLTTASTFNTTTAGDFDLAAVRGDSTKVIVGGWATTNWSVQALNVPVTGAITTASTLFSTGIANSTFHFAIDSTTRDDIAGVTTYYVAACTLTATFRGQLINFDRTTNTFTLVGTAVTYTRTTRIDGLLVDCLSTGTNHNAVVAVTDAGNPSEIRFFQQLNNTQAVAESQATTLTLNHSTAKSLQRVFNWGNERAVFIGLNNTLVGYNSAGVATNLITATDTNNSSSQINHWFPFNSRPLYTFFSVTSPDPTLVAQYYSRKNVTSATNFGVRQELGNYFPYGHDYDARQYAWSDVANCWIVAQGGRVYALSAAGVVLNEITAYNLNTSFSVQDVIKDLTVTNSGQIIIACSRNNGYSTTVSCSTQWGSLVNTMQTGVTAPVTSANALSTSVVPTVNNISGFLNGKFFNFVDATNTEVFYYIYYQTIANPVIAVAKWITLNGVTTYSTTIAVGGMGTAVGAWHYGSRVNHRLFMSTPANTTFTEGKWRIIGQRTWSSEAEARQLGCSTTPYVFAAFGSMNPGEKQLSSTQVSNAYGISGNTNKNFSIAVAYDPLLLAHRILYSNVINYTMSWIDTGVLPSTSTATQFYKVRTSKYAATVSLNNTSYSSTVPITYVYDTSNTQDARITLTGTSGYGVVNNTNVDKVSFSVFGQGVNKKYTVSGPAEVAKVSVIVTNEVQNFYVTKDQVLNANGFYRSTDTYLIPPGASIKLQSDTPVSISSMLTVVEEV